MPTIRVQTEDFDVGMEYARLCSSDAGIGAVAAFIGLVRDINDGAGVSGMTLEHYPGMTEKALAGIVQQAQQRWQIVDCTVIHRVGELKPADQIVLVLVASRHRSEAFEACQFIMDYLKTQAPFWKKEQTPCGERWVEPHAIDEEAASRWKR